MHTFEQAVNYWCREKSGKARKTTGQSYTVIDCKTCCAAAKCTYVGGVLEHHLERVGQERARSVYSGLVDAAGPECNSDGDLRCQRVGVEATTAAAGRRDGM
jgi:hypothetical protein